MRRNPLRKRLKTPRCVAARMTKSAFMPSTFSSTMRRYRLLPVSAVILLFFSLTDLLLSVEEKRITVFASGKTYSVAVTDSEKTEYAALSEVLQPLGKLTL